MKFNIYDYDNEPTEVDTGDKEISCIMIEVIAGNEFIHIIYEDGTIKHCSSERASISLYEGGYTVLKGRIQEWIDLEKVTDEFIPYYRLEKFEEGKNNERSNKF